MDLKKILHEKTLCSAYTSLSGNTPMDAKGYVRWTQRKLNIFIFLRTLYYCVGMVYSSLVLRRLAYKLHTFCVKCSTPKVNGKKSFIFLASIGVLPRIAA